jgi:hypothetical protein
MCIRVMTTISRVGVKQLGQGKLTQNQSRLLISDIEYKFTRISAAGALLY